MPASNPLLRSALRLALFSTTTAALTLGTSIVHAQQQDDSLEEITVTGSRIARDPNLGGALPIQSVDAQEIQLSGEFSVSDVVNDIPALLGSITAEQSPEAPADTGVADGANVLNLRNLGVERTLVLVDGRRHVGGVAGTASVDVGSIPMGLVERVEVLTGGASAVYGADAVTGVVNFILKDNYEGFGVDVNYGMSSEGDGAQTSISALWGMNFADDRGNVAIAVDYRTDEGLSRRDRNDFLIGTGRDWVNPDRRFQRGEINADTPNFRQYYNYGNGGLTDYGLAIPVDSVDDDGNLIASGADNFAALYNDSFGMMPSLTAAEQALIDRANTAPQRAVLAGRTFPFTSGYGMIIPGNPNTFSGFDPETPIDLNGNGRPDCLDSWTGYQSVFGTESFGAIGGCWNVTEAGAYTVVQDGLVANQTQGFGGSSLNTIAPPRGDIILPNDRITVNLLSSYDLKDDMTLFGEVKYVTQKVQTTADPNSFWDLLGGAPDNPFLPSFIQPVADANGGVAITIDPLGFNNRRTTERETMRAVIGLEGAFDNDWTYEVSANYGVYNERIERTASAINDRFFAAIDAVTDPATGQPACRADVDPTAPAQTTPFNIPAYSAGYFSYTPGSGDCVPLNIWAGQSGFTDEARAWVTTPTWDDTQIEQFVLSAFVTGDSSDLFELPAGAIAFAGGIEYREESSDARFDPFQRGIIPAGSPFPAGTALEDVSDNSSLTFRPQIPIRPEEGSFDAIDVFVETSVPLLVDKPMARELTVDLAYRFSDYSTIGGTNTWKTNLIWTPVNSLTVRGGVSEAVRAPNVTELFGPLVGSTFRPVDPCDAAQIAAIGADDPTLAANTQANCVADFQALGFDPFDANGAYVFADPLTAAFGGLSGGNSELKEETASTITAGFVFQPEFLEGLSLTVDYWSIEIDDAIETVTAQNIVDGCYQATSLVDEFCSLFTRGAGNGGFTFLQSGDVNFAKIETSGVDAVIKYAWDVGGHGFDVTLQGTTVNEIDFFTNPSDLTDVNPELGEILRPELSGNIHLGWQFGDVRVGWQSQFLDEMLVRFVEIETARSLYGDAVFQDAFWQHDINARWQANDNMTIYGGIKNLTNEEPFVTDRGFPASARGPFYFVGLDYQM